MIESEKKSVHLIKKKRLVEGDPNLVTEDEILVQETKDKKVILKERDSSGKLVIVSTDKYKPVDKDVVDVIYYKVKRDRYDSQYLPEALSGNWNVTEDFRECTNGKIPLLLSINICRDLQTISRSTRSISLKCIDTEISLLRFLISINNMDHVWEIPIGFLSNSNNYVVTRIYFIWDPKTNKLSPPDPTKRYRIKNWSSKVLQKFEPVSPFIKPAYSGYFGLKYNIGQECFGYWSPGINVYRKVPILKHFTNEPNILESKTRTYIKNRLCRYGCTPEWKDFNWNH